MLCLRFTSLNVSKILRLSLSIEVRSCFFLTWTAPPRMLRNSLRSDAPRRSVLGIRWNITRSISASSCSVFSGAHIVSTNFCSRYFTFSTLRPCRRLSFISTAGSSPERHRSLIWLPVIGVGFVADFLEALKTKLSSTDFDSLNVSAPPANAINSASALFPSPVPQ